MLNNIKFDSLMAENGGKLKNESTQNKSTD